jgi:hypothetical protein
MGVQTIQNLPTALHDHNGSNQNIRDPVSQPVYTFISSQKVHRRIGSKTKWRHETDKLGRQWTIAAVGWTGHAMHNGVFLN